jgi:hypothetical protein
MRPVVVAVAITGSAPRKRDNPALPTTPAEQIESTHEAYEAGATLTHVHVRNPDESPSSDPALFAEVMQGVRKTCPRMIVQFSTGGRGRDPAARGSALPLRPDMASLAPGNGVSRGRSLHAVAFGSRLPPTRSAEDSHLQSSAHAWHTSSRRRGLLLRASHRTGHAGLASGSLDRCFRARKRVALNPSRGSTRAIGS